MLYKIQYFCIITATIMLLQDILSLSNDTSEASWKPNLHEQSVIKLLRNRI